MKPRIKLAASIDQAAGSAAVQSICLPRSASEADLVSVWIKVGYLADAVFVGLLLCGVEAASANLRDYRIEIVYEDGVLAVTGVFWALLDVDVAVSCKLPYGLNIVWQERGRGPQKLLVPLQRGCIVGDRNACEQVEALC